MKRRLFNLAAALSFALFASTAVMWIRSYSVTTRVSRNSFLSAASHNVISAESYSGRVYLQDLRYGPQEQMSTTNYRIENFKHRRGWGVARAFEGNQPTWLGFGIFSDFQGVQMYRVVMIPIWAIAMLFLTLPVVATVKAVRRARQVPNTCPTCGYNLRESPDRCPECGTARPSST